MPSVLVIDDHAPSRDFLATLLRHAGVEVHEAADGLEGLELISAQHPDMVVCDLLMPRMDGFEMAKRLRAMPEIARTPVVFCTATYLAREAQRMASALGVVAVLLKPVAAEELFACVGRCVGLSAPLGAVAAPQFDLDHAHVRLLADKLCQTTSQREQTSQRLALVVEASEQFLGTTSVSELADLLCRTARKIVGAKLAFVAMLDARRKAHPPAAAQGFSDEERRSIVALPELVARLSRSRVVCTDAPGTPPAEELVRSSRPLANLLAVRLGPEERPDGLVLCADRLGEGFTGDDQSFLAMLADLAHAGIQRTLLTRQLQQAQKMEAVGRLAGGVAHDFNNLLTVIQGQSHLLLERLDDPHTVEALSEIKQAAERAGALTRQLLTFSRNQVLLPQIVPLNEVVRETERMLRRIIGEHIALSLDIVPETGYVRVDPNQLGQVLLNLAVNARDAMPDGGRLTIGTGLVELDAEQAAQYEGIGPGRYAVLRFTDTGHGMDEETRSRAFEPFFTTKEAGRGTGLGLSMVHGIVRQSGGSVAIVSQPGQGAVLEVLLPPAPGAPEAARLAAGFRATTDLGTVLVVEDENAVRKLMGSILRKAGYRVLDAGEPDAALELAHAHAGTIEVLVTDVVMPGMTGMALYAALIESRPGLRVLYCSGYAERLAAQQLVLPERSLFLPKPFQSASLLEKVREALGRPL